MFILDIVDVVSCPNLVFSIFALSICFYASNMKFVSKVLDFANRTIYQTRYLFTTTAIFAFIGNIQFWSEGGLLSVVYWFLAGTFPSFIYSAIASSRFKLLSAIGYAAGIVQILLCAVNAISWSIWDLSIGCRMLGILFGTTANEASGFMDSLANNLSFLAAQPSFWGAVFCIATSVVVTRYISPRTFNISTAILMPLSLFSAAYMSLFAEVGRRNISMTLRTALAVDHVYTSAKHTKIAIQQYLANKSSIPNATSDNKIDNFVLILGESSSLFHWNLYGYGLPTTPRLDALKDNLIIKHNTIPAYPSTRETTRGILTEYESDGHTYEWFKYANITALAKKAGFKTHWLSNQDKISQFMDCVSVLSEISDVSRHTSIISDDGIDKLPYDDTMLTYLETALKDTSAHKRLIVLHQKSSHAIYANNFPASEALFTPDDEKKAHIRGNELSPRQLKIAADYDNSILMTDKVLASAIEILSQTPGRNVLVFLSDHSEDVFDIDNYCDHAYRGKFIMVPQIYWASDEWIAAHPDIVDNLRKTAKLRTSSEWMFHTFLNLMGIQTPVYDPTQDVSSSYFNPDRPIYFNGEKYNP